RPGLGSWPKLPDHKPEVPLQPTPGTIDKFPRAPHTVSLLQCWHSSVASSFCRSSPRRLRKLLPDLPVHHPGQPRLRVIQVLREQDCTLLELPPGQTLENLSMNRNQASRII